MARSSTLFRLAFRLLAWTGALLATFASGSSQTPTPEPPKQKLPSFVFHPPRPGAASTAAREGIELRIVAPGNADRPLLAGEGVNALVNLADEKEQLQWIVQVAGSDLTAKEAATGSKNDATRTFYSSTGNSFRFPVRRAALAVRVIGPFKDAGRQKPPPDKRVRAITNPDYLALGFDRATAAIVRLREESARPGAITRKLPPGSLGFGFEPFPREAIEKSRPLAEGAGLKLEDERALVGTLPALMEFFQVVSKTPGLQEILLSVLDIPWWSLIKNLGRPPDVGIEWLSREIREIDPTPWGLAGETLYTLPLAVTIDKKRILVCQLAVTRPRGALVATAGIVGIAAQRPDGKGPALTIRVVGTQAGGEGKVKSED